jgi:high frequency lysogenization protein
VQSDYRQIAIALAGVTQATGLVRQLAQTGKIAPEPFNTSIYSLFQTDITQPSHVYGNLDNLRWGLEKLIIQMSAHPDRVLTRYMLSVIYLQKKLARSPKLSNNLTERIHQIKKQVDYFSLTHPTVIANLADAYVSTLHACRFRIIVWGHQRTLSVHENMEKIRALLLAGMRSAIIWRQLGGSRWHLLFSRAKIKDAAEKLLADIN